VSDNNLIMKYKRGVTYYEDYSGDIVSKTCTTCNKNVPLSGYGNKKDGLAGKMAVCRDCELARQQKYREDNQGKIRLMNQKYYLENQDVIREKQRLFHQENPHFAKERGRRWKIKNRDMLRERARIQRKENPEKSRMIVHRRLARKRCLPDTLTAEQANEIFLHFGGCALTGEDDIHWDHVIPLITGHGGTSYGNMVPLRSDLNLSKNDSNIFVWFEANRQRFNLSQENFDSLISWLAMTNEISVEDYRDYVYWCHENHHCLEDLRENDEGEAI
jgi:hypothetical protein